MLVAEVAKSLFGVVSAWQVPEAATTLTACKPLAFGGFLGLALEAHLLEICRNICWLQCKIIGTPSCLKFFQTFQDGSSVGARIQGHSYKTPRVSTVPLPMKMPLAILSPEPTSREF